MIFLVLWFYGVHPFSVFALFIMWIVLCHLGNHPKTPADLSLQLLQILQPNMTHNEPFLLVKLIHFHHFLAHPFFPHQNTVNLRSPNIMNSTRMMLALGLPRAVWLASIFGFVPRKSSHHNPPHAIRGGYQNLFPKSVVFGCFLGAHNF